MGELLLELAQDRMTGKRGRFRLDAVIAQRGRTQHAYDAFFGLDADKTVAHVPPKVL